MRRPFAVLALGLAGTAIVAACSIAWGFPPHPSGSVQQVLATNGTVWSGSVFHTLTFTVWSPGGVLVGEAAVADWCGTFYVIPAGTEVFPQCPASCYPVNGSVSFQQTLNPGGYSLVHACGGSGNATVTQAIELLYP